MEWSNSLGCWHSPSYGWALNDPTLTFLYSSIINCANLLMLPDAILTRGRTKTVVQLQKVYYSIFLEIRLLRSSKKKSNKVLVKMQRVYQVLSVMHCVSHRYKNFNRCSSDQHPLKTLEKTEFWNWNNLAISRGEFTLTWWDEASQS